MKTKDLMKSRMEALDLNVLECLSKAFEYYFENSFLNFISGTSKEGYIEYAVALIHSMPHSELKEGEVLNRFYKALEMAEEQARFLKRPYSSR